MARTVLPIVGAVVGAYFGSPQIGYAIGAVIGNAVDPLKVQGPKIGETGAQTTAEGVPRPIIYGTISCTGNVIVAGPLVITEVETQEGKGGGPVTTSDRCFRTYAIRISEGPVAGVLRIWEDEKLVYDIRTVSVIQADTEKWAAGTRIYLGTEDQLPDSALEVVDPDMPAYRGTAYMVFDSRDLTDRRGSIPQYRFEVASVLSLADVGSPTASTNVPVQVTAGEKQTQYIHLHYLGDNGEGQTNCRVLTRTGEVNVQTPGAFYPLHEYDQTCTNVETTNQLVGGSGWSTNFPTVTEIVVWGAMGSYAFAVRGTFPNSWAFLMANGDCVGFLKPGPGYADDWFSNNTEEDKRNQRRIWFSSTHLYVGLTTRVGSPVNEIYRWGLGGGFPSYANIITGVCSTPGAQFFMHVGRDGKLRVINDIGVMKTYNEATMALESSVNLPFSLTDMHGFGVDDGTAAFVYRTSSTVNTVEIRSTSSWDLRFSYTHPKVSTAEINSTRVVFASGSLYVQAEDVLFRMPYNQADGAGVLLSDIVDDIHVRCKVEDGKWDTTELTDVVAGLLLAGDYTGADAINTLRSPYFFDAYNADKKIWYPKRGADASFVLDIDDLVEDPDTSKREQAIEYPKKVHLQYQHANSGYAVVKATSARSSPDARVVGEMTLSVPIVLNEDQAAQTAAKIHKVAWAEADGELEISLPDSFIQYTPTDVGSITLRGQTTRRRIETWDYADGIIKWKMKKDRQSAYTSDVQGVPVPDPTPPPSTIVGETILAVMDIPSRIDTEDDLNIYYGVTGAMPAWYGAMVQRSIDAGANYTNVASIDRASIMGYITGGITDASEHITDTTNVLTVTLYRDGQLLEGLTNLQFLQEGGAFALEKPDGSWEIMQYRDCVEDSNGNFILSTLHRGRLNSGTDSHNDGALFVMLDRPTHVEMTSGFIGVDLTHRAASFGDAPELATEQTATYVGRSQIEWEPVYLDLERDGSDVITATWIPRYRFGNDVNPVDSINARGFRITIDDGVLPAVTFDTTAANFTYDASALGASVDVSVSAINRITGPGPAVTGTV